MQKAAVFNWSGGKDSMLALHQILSEKQYAVRYLLTTISDVYDRISIHGVRTYLLKEQAKQLGLPLIEIRLPEIPDMITYEEAMKQCYERFHKEGIRFSIFGDIFLEDLKAYREQQCSKLGIQTIFPLWKRNSREVIEQFIDLGYKTIVVAAREDLKEFCGRIIDTSFIADLPRGVDLCGENGEFHTFVFDGPLFQHPVLFQVGETVFKYFPKTSSGPSISGYWYTDLV